MHCAAPGLPDGVDQHQSAWCMLCATPGLADGEDQNLQDLQKPQNLQNLQHISPTKDGGENNFLQNSFRKWRETSVITKQTPQNLQKTDNLEGGQNLQTTYQQKCNY